MSAFRNIVGWSTLGLLSGLIIVGIATELRDVFSGFTGYCEWGWDHLKEYGCNSQEMKVYNTEVMCSKFNCTKQIEFNAAFADVESQNRIFMNLAFFIAFSVGFLLCAGIGIYRNWPRKINHHTLFSDIALDNLENSKVESPTQSYTQLKV